MSHIHANFNTPELAQAIDADKAKPLIMEMHKKYGLQAFHITTVGKLNNRESRDETRSPKVFCLTSPHNGLLYGAVWADDIGNDEVRYHFFSKSFKKNRGWDYVMSRTLTSIKLSTLMRSIAKHKAVADVSPKESTVLMPFGEVSDISRIIYQTVKGVDTINRLSRSPSLLSTNAMLDLLNVYMGKKNRTQVDLEMDANIVETYDNLNQARLIEQEVTKKKNDVANREMYVIVADESSAGYAVGKVHLNVDVGRKEVYKISEPFVRVADLDQYKDIDKIRPILTMFKVHTEDEVRNYRVQDLIIKNSKYYEDVDIINHSPQYSYNSQHGNSYLYIPTGN